MSAVTVLSPEERQAIEAAHQPSDLFPGCACGQNPCDSARLLGALRAAEGERKKLRAALVEFRIWVPWAGTGMPCHQLDLAITRACKLLGIEPPLMIGDDSPSEIRRAALAKSRR